MDKQLTYVPPAAPDDRVIAYRPPVSEQDVAAFKSTVLAKLTLAVGKNPVNASDRDWFVAAALAVRDRIVHRWMESYRRTRIENRKRVYYLSLEFLIGRLLRDVLHNLELTDTVNAALGDLGVDLERMFVAEPDVMDDLRPLELPRIAEGQPVLRVFLLRAVLDHLAEQAVVVADAVAAGRDGERRHAFHKARREAPQAAIAERGVRFGHEHVLEIDA